MSAKEITEAIAELLKALAQMAEPAVAHAWGAMVWGVMVDGITRLIAGLVLIITGTAIALYLRDMFKKWGNENPDCLATQADDDSDITLALIILVLLFVLFVGFVLAITSLRYLLAPEYVLIFKLLGR